MDYNKLMGGVDHTDQIRNKCDIKQKSYIDTSFGWLHYSQNLTCGSKTTHQLTIKNFQLSTANTLISEYNARQQYTLLISIRTAWQDSFSPATKHTRVDTNTPDTEGHYPVKDTRVRCAFWEHHRTLVAGRVLTLSSARKTALESIKKAQKC